METINRVVTLIQDNFNIELSEEQISQLKQYEELLITWNQKFNLTAIKDHEGIWFRHFLDSASILPLITKQNATLVDVGSGAGFPGIVIKIIRPDLNILLVDSTAKKITFLNNVINELKLKNIKALAVRSEELARQNEYREQFDYATTRAVSSFNACLELCVGLVKVDGHILLMRGPKGQEEGIESLGKQKEFSLAVAQENSFLNPFNNMTSYLFSFLKSKKTNLKFPRRFDQIIKDNK